MPTAMRKDRLMIEQATAQPSTSDTSAPHFIAKIKKARDADNTCLPQHLGLEVQEYVNYFKVPVIPHSDDTRQELLELRHDEWLDLVELLNQHANTVDIHTNTLAKVIASACLGGGHLWRDLGLDTREELKTLLGNSFTSLAKKNDKNMRWKKFFYKQLCEQEGGYVCRSPSCETCTSYDECFGEEI